MELRFADRSERSKLRFTGEQRAWFLHQIVTNSFQDIAPGTARAAAMLTPHGRMVGFFEAVATEDAIYVHFEPELRDSFPDVIRRYVFATQVEIDDVGDQMGLVLVVGEQWRDLAGKIEGAIPHETNFLGPPAGYLWLPTGAVGVALTQLRDAGVAEATEEELEEARIRSGRPRWGRDMDHKTLPQEARLEEFGALEFEKGCYVGQEAVAKIHFRGKVNRKVRRIEAETPVETGADVMQGEARVGVVTSAAGTAALAVLRHTVEPDADVQISGAPARVAD